MQAIAPVRLVIALVAALMVLLPAVVRADASQMEGLRLEAFGGAFHTLGELRSPRGGAVGKLGYGLDNGLVLELTGGFWDHWRTIDEVDDDNAAILQFPLLAGIRCRLLNSSVRPYVGLHIGYVLTRNYYYTDGWGGRESWEVDKGGFGLQAEVGFEFMIGRHFFLDLGAGYLLSTGNIAVVNTTDEKFGNGHSLFVGLGLGVNIPITTKRKPRPDAPSTQTAPPTSARYAPVAPQNSWYSNGAEARIWDPLGAARTALGAGNIRQAIQILEDGGNGRPVLLMLLHLYVQTGDRLGYERTAHKFMALYPADPKTVQLRGHL